MLLPLTRYCQKRGESCKFKVCTSISAKNEFYSFFIFKFNSQKFVLARLGAKSKLKASISPPSAIPKTLATIIEQQQNV